MERHPPELPQLFLTEMWERFSFYLMLGLLPLYMIADPAAGGLGFDEAKSGLIIGTYVGLVYFTPFIGGLLADKVIGYRNSVVIGAITMCAGHVSLAFENMAFFYMGLALLIVGNGFFKPNISTMLGRLYSKKSPLKDSGFSIFYMGINVGGFFCNFVAAIVRNAYGWHAAFGTAGIGLAIGLIIFLTVYKRLERAEVRREEQQDEAQDDSMAVLWSKVLPAVVIMAMIGYWGIGHWDDDNKVTWAFFGACVPVLVFYYRLWATASEEERGPIGALLAISLVLVPFWMVFDLNSTALSFWAEKNTNREVGAKVVGTLQAVNLLENASPSYFNNAEPSTPRPNKSWLEIINIITDGDEDLARKGEEEIKKTYAKALATKGYEEAGPVPVTEEEYLAVYEHSDGGTLEPGVPLHVANAELFQSVNPAWVVMLAPLFVGVWNMLSKRKREPTTPSKIGLGMLFASGCWLVMLAAAVYSGDGDVKVSPFWLIGAYGVLTMGELCLSPVGLSLVTKLAPARLGAVMMGGFFMSTAIGGKLSGVIGGPVWKAVPHSYFFIGLAVLMVVFALIMYRLTPWLNRYMKKEETKDDRAEAATT